MTPVRIVELEPVSSKFSRFVLVVLGLCNTVFAWGTANLTYIDVPLVWSALFLAGAVMCFISALHFERTTLIVATGPLLVVACVFRAGALSVGKLSGLSTVPWPTVIQGSTLWCAFAFCLFIMFWRGMVPLSVRKRNVRRA